MSYPNPNTIRWRTCEELDTPLANSVQGCFSTYFFNFFLVDHGRGVEFNTEPNSETDGIVTTLTATKCSMLKA